MSYTVTLQQRIQQLKKAQADLPGILSKAAKGATERAVEKATEKTPTTLNSLRGTNTRTGEMKQHWATDSKVNPEIRGGQLVTVLANDKEYASYVDQGHRMDRHFVPGLVVDENGMLSYNPDGKGGIVVGTKTKYIKGKFMVDQAKREYERVIILSLDKEIRRLMD